MGENVVGALNVACTVRVVKNWPRPEHLGAKAHILELAKNVVEGQDDLKIHSEILWLYEGSGYAS